MFLQRLLAEVRVLHAHDDQSDIKEQAVKADQKMTFNKKVDSEVVAALTMAPADEDAIVATVHGPPPFSSSSAWPMVDAQPAQLPVVPPGSCPCHAVFGPVFPPLVFWRPGLLLHQILLLAGRPAAKN